MNRNDDGTSVPLTQNEQVNHALLLQWMKSGWESNDPDVVVDHFHPDCEVIGLAPEVLEGVEQVEAAHRAICARLKHRTAEILSTLIRGDQFAVLLLFEGHHRDSEIDVAFEVACMGRMKNGLIYRAHNTIDYTGLYAKLGVLDMKKFTAMFA